MFFFDKIYKVIDIQSTSLIFWIDASIHHLVQLKLSQLNKKNIKFVIGLWVMSVNITISIVTLTFLFFNILAS